MALMMKDSLDKFARRHSLKKEVPGVGEYDIASSTDFTRIKVPAFRIGTSDRSTLDKLSKNFPGPSQYDLFEGS